MTDTENPDLIQHATTMYKCLMLLAKEVAKKGDHDSSGASSGDKGYGNSAMGAMKAAGLGLGAGVAIPVAGVVGLGTGLVTAPTRRAIESVRRNVNRYNDLFYYLKEYTNPLTLGSMGVEFHLNQYYTLQKHGKQADPKLVTWFDRGVLKQAETDIDNVEDADAKAQIKQIITKFEALPGHEESPTGEAERVEFARGQAAQTKQLALYKGLMNQRLLKDSQLYTAKNKNEDSSFLGLGSRIYNRTKKFLGLHGGRYTQRHLNKRSTLRVRGRQPKSGAHA